MVDMQVKKAIMIVWVFKNGTTVGRVVAKSTKVAKLIVSQTEKLEREILTVASSEPVAKASPLG